MAGDKYCEFIESIIHIQPEVHTFNKYDNEMHFKIDILEKVLDRARFHLHHHNNKLTQGDFGSLGVTVGAHRELLISPPLDKRASDGKPTYKRPEDLEVPLLIYLLLIHNEKLPVLKVIERFTAEINQELNIYDFEKTSTGVMRCYTNTRFAARRLREKGLCTCSLTHKQVRGIWM
ncbi:MAG: hypothetical protein ISR96_07990 [Nitrospira sp.]|nr:hypothetical protein [Nitrospira sp.]